MRKRRKGHALSRRYGRAASGPLPAGEKYAIEQSGNLFLVKLTRDLDVGGGKSVAAGRTLGTINERGTLSVWRSAGYNPRGYGEIAKILLEDARHALKSSGHIMARQRAKEAAEEQASGSFIVKIGNSTSRFHSFDRARTEVEKALLTMPVGTQAKFYRAGVSGRTTWADGRPLEGIPWTEPFHIMETYEWNGQKRVGMPRGATS